MHLALTTCTNLPDWEVDDATFHDALAERGVQYDRPVWDDPSVDWSAFDACLIRTTWDYQEKRDAFVDWADRIAKVTKLFNPPDIVRWNTHKSYLLDLQDRGVATVPTVWINPGDDEPLERVVRDRGWSRGFLKPAIGASARATLRFDTSAEGLERGATHLSKMLHHSESMLLQPYLPRVETEGEFSIIFFDGAFSHGVQKIPTAGDYRVQDDFGASDKPWNPTAEEIALAKRTLDAVGADLLYARADFLRSDAGELLLNELELVEPSLFFRHSKTAAQAFAGALCRRVGNR